MSVDGIAHPIASLSVIDEIDNILDGSPATDLAKVLVKNLIADLSNVQRNIRTYFQLLRKIVLVYNSIQSLIEKVHTPPNVDWESFEQYTAAIEPLERYAGFLIESEIHQLNFITCHQCSSKSS
jgi:hypothetical protein